MARLKVRTVGHKSFDTHDTIWIYLINPKNAGDDHAVIIYNHKTQRVVAAYRRGVKHRVTCKQQHLADIARQALAGKAFGAKDIWVEIDL